MCDAEEYDDDDGDDHDGHGASTHTADSTTASELESMMTTTGFREKRPVRSLSFGAWTCRLFRGAGLGGERPEIPAEASRYRARASPEPFGTLRLSFRTSTAVGLARVRCLHSVSLHLHTSYHTCHGLADWGLLLNMIIENPSLWETLEVTP